MHERRLGLRVPYSLVLSLGLLGIGQINDPPLVTCLLFEDSIVLVDISRALFFHEPVAPVHLIHGPEQRCGGLFRVGDHGYEQVGKILVDG